MSAQKLVSIILKVFGMSVFLRFLTEVVYLPYQVLQWGARELISFDGVRTLVDVCVAACLFFSSEWAARRIVRDDEPVTVSAPVSASLAAVALQCLGISVLAVGIPGFVQGIAYFLLRSGQTSGPAGLSLWLTQYLMPVLRIGMGVVILFGARWLVRLLHLPPARREVANDDGRQDGGTPPQA